MPRPSALRIVDHTTQLTGVAPAAMERAARLAGVGDRTHRGLIFLCSTFARHALRACCPPGAHQAFLPALTLAENWAHDRADQRAVRKARSDAFNAIALAERLAVNAISATFSASTSKKPTPIDEHANGVVLRYAGLAANYACGAVLLTLDSVDSPSKACLVPGQAAGALAYQAGGLGPARSIDLRVRACEQAEWENEREAAFEWHGSAALAVLLFHEFLGAYWRQYSDGQRAYFDDFTGWALAETGA